MRSKISDFNQSHIHDNPRQDKDLSDFLIMRSLSGGYQEYEFD